MCIKYLHSACFDVDIDDKTLSSYTRSGAYVLLAYVYNHWLHHIGKVGKQEFQELMQDVQSLVDSRVNESFVGQTVISNSPDADGSQRLSSTEEISQMLDRAHAFSNKRKRDLNFDDGTQR
jgi:hypothetical protein